MTGRRKIIYEAKQKGGCRISNAYEVYSRFCDQVHMSFPLGLLILEERPQGWHHGTVVPERFQVQSALASEDVNKGVEERVQDIFQRLHLDDYYLLEKVEQ